jgi:DNA-binding NarL/FixJ family response regulator
MTPTTVVIADDHPVVRAGLRELLRSSGDIEVVGEAANGVEAVELATALRPDLVLMDLAMPELDGVEATRLITAARPEVVVVALTTYDDAAHVRAALDAGARGYLRKDIGPEQLVAGIRAAASQWILVSPAINPLASPVAETAEGTQ